MQPEDFYPPYPVMIVDDEEQTLRSCKIALRTSGLTNVETVQDSRHVIGKIEKSPYSLVVLDLSMPHLTGEELLKHLRSEFSDLPVIILTGYNDLETAVSCMREGAFDYLVKPVEKNRLVASVKRAIQFRELEQVNFQLKKHLLTDELEHPEAFKEIRSVSKTMRSIFRYVESIAVTNQPVLVTGETGVGKELMARAIHRLSESKGTFVPINVAGLDDTVFSDTLFGHRKGAFTGAAESRKGLVESAAGGTLFLDEIGDLTPMSQVKLLRLLQEREYYPLGSDVPKRSDARIVVATNQPLKTLIKEGKFRKDLYFRLQTHQVILPPLRERKEDIAVIVEHFLEEAATNLKKPKPRIPEQLWTLLKNYHFPGNIRELESMVYDAMSKNRSGALSLDVFRERIFKESKSQSVDSSPSDESGEKPQVIFPDRLPSLKEIGDLLLIEAMRRSDNNQSIAAQMLGVTQQALSKRMKKMRETAKAQAEKAEA